jgi:hypothetical protein
MRDETEHERLEIFAAASVDAGAKLLTENAALRSQLDAANGQNVELRSALELAWRYFPIGKPEQGLDYTEQHRVIKAALANDGSAVVAELAAGRRVVETVRPFFAPDMTWLDSEYCCFFCGDWSSNDEDRNAMDHTADCEWRKAQDVISSYDAATDGMELKRDV